MTNYRVTIRRDFIDRRPEFEGETIPWLLEFYTDDKLTDIVGLKSTKIAREFLTAWGAPKNLRVPWTLNWGVWESTWQL